MTLMGGDGPGDIKLGHALEKDTGWAFPCCLLFLVSRMWAALLHTLSSNICCLCHRSWCTVSWHLMPLGGRSSHRKVPSRHIVKTRAVPWDGRVDKVKHPGRTFLRYSPVPSPPWWDQMFPFFLRSKSRLSCDFTLLNVDSYLKYFYFLQVHLLGNWTIIYPSNLRSHFILQASTEQVLAVTMQETFDLFSLPCIMRTQGHLYTGNFWLYLEEEINFFLSSHVSKGEKETFCKMKNFNFFPPRGKLSGKY